MTDRTKCVEVDRHFIKLKIESGEICVLHVSSLEQTTNILTKGLQQHFFLEDVEQVWIVDVYNPT